MSSSQVVVTLGSSRNISGFEKEKIKELLEKDVRNSNDFLEVFNYPSEAKREEWNDENLSSWKRCQMFPMMVESLSDCVGWRR